MESTAIMANWKGATKISEVLSNVSLGGQGRVSVGADLKNRYLRTVKLAAAIAIIRSKPPGRSGREQAEYLAAKIKSQDEDWKAKAQHLQGEVLHLRQELLLTKVLSKTSSCDGSAQHSSSDPLFLDLVNSTKETPNWDKDSGCEIGESTEALTATPDTGESQMELVQVPPAHSTQLSPVPGSGTQERAMLVHTQFLQNLIGLARLEGEGVLEVSGDWSVVPDSIYQVLSSMVSVFRDPHLFPRTPPLLQAARVAARAVDHGNSGRRPSAHLMTQMEDFLKELTDLLLSSSQLNRFHMQETLANCLILLGGSSLLKPLVVRHILSQISSFADQLWETCQDEREGCQHFPVGKYENSFYLLWVLEQLLQGGAGSGWVGWRQQLGQLERRALELSEEFPLFAIYTWRVTAHPGPIDRREVPSTR